MAGDIDVWSSAVSQARALRSREISASELLGLYRERIARHNPALNAIVVECFDRAERRAREIDEFPASSIPEPLAGLPMTIKESIEVEGLLTTGGVPHLKGRISPVDSPNYEALRDAGMVLMGKTNIPTRCADWQSNSPIYGRTNNPWNLGRSPGGSSGGSAAALASAMTPLELGTDIGGSVRVPASFCGVYGLRPSDTAMPRYRGFPEGLYPNDAAVMNTNGPLARYPEDIEMTLDIMARPVVGEGVAWRIEIPAARHERLADFRVGFLQSMDWVPVAESVRGAIQTVRSALERTGARIVEVDPEGLLGGSREHFVNYLGLVTAVMCSTLDEEQRLRLREAVRDNPDYAEAIDKALNGPPTVVFDWHALRQVQKARFRELFKDIDIIVSPAWPRPAYEHIPYSGAPFVELFERTLEIDGVEHSQELGLVYPAVSTFAGQPALAFPVSIDSDGLPVGLQAIGPNLEDRTVIRFAQRLAEQIGGFVKPPGYD